MFKPELLAPAGNLEKLKIAFSYGADAVYVGGHVFGLRKYADNFSLAHLKEGIQLANDLGKHVYLVLNGFAHNTDIEEIRTHLEELNDVQPHALIISDMGVFQLAKSITNIPLHVSTQASVTNAYGCQFWKDAGASRVILAREVSIDDCKRIKESVDTELEIFVHGAMCASYSGKCVISNYTAGRDSNRGGCVQTCRHDFEIKDQETGALDHTSHIMNAKDLMGIRQLPAVMQAGIESVKVEGRMKSNLYAANISRTYRKAIDYVYDTLKAGKTCDEAYFDELEAQLSTVSNRGFSSGGLEERPYASSIAYEFNQYEKQVDYIGSIKAVEEGQSILLDVKFSFENDDILELLTFDGNAHPFQVSDISNMLDARLKKTNPNSLVKLPWIEGAKVNAVIQRPIRA
jgi:U32 family peptidase